MFYEHCADLNKQSSHLDCTSLSLAVKDVSIAAIELLFIEKEASRVSYYTTLHRGRGKVC